jgi:hypothetical protein
MLMTDRHNGRILHLERTKNPRIKHIHTTLTAYWRQNKKAMFDSLCTLNGKQ